ncbi:glycosyltransferase [Janibacter melonis]|uniref:dolichyl-phosphate beta-glucosyltransferase n=1 Tax=Janibacter melonis TaxID=262209 RepID=A0A650GED5_9MICO|nr:bifunctional glycosyltransferase family 2/GtrA family protein [Janibacter melonis]QGX08667.1 glycosyltransferase [Janibacter melonis]
MSTLVRTEPTPEVTGPPFAPATTPDPVTRVQQERPGPSPVLDVVVPVYDEEVTLAACVRRLHAHLRDTFPYPYRITVADNASTDRTWQVALDLVEVLPEVAAVHLDAKGRGRALRAVWAASDAPVLAYMDVDLSTDLDALWPLVAPLMSGHSDLAIGTRLHRTSRVVRGTLRETTSRGYNLLLRAGLGVGFSDAQCGFKAVRADVAAELLPLVEDTAWFFDTELLVLAERCRLRIHEVPVDWWDDPDSRVDVVGTALDDLRGMRRVHRALRRGELPVEQIRERVGRNAPVGGVVGGQVVRFALVGATTTLLHLALFAVLATAVAPQPSNLLALLVATVVNTSANRRWTFGLSGARGALRHQAQGLAIFGATWAMTAGGLAALGAVLPHAPTPLQTLVVGGCTVAATVAKFALMRRW